MEQEQRLIQLAKLLSLLEAAKLRKMGYERWDSAAIWFSTYEQKHRIEIINKAIDRIRNKAYELTTQILIHI